jgi:hypothetical protein
LFSKQLAERLSALQASYLEETHPSIPKPNSVPSVASAHSVVSLLLRLLPFFFDSLLKAIVVA